MYSKVVLIFLILLTLFSSKPILAETYEENKTLSERIESRKLDKQAKILAEYLTAQDSPLQYHAQDFIEASKEYDLDWRLVAAISGVESTFGKFIPGGYNGWGWGVYGTQAIYFNSWKEAIYTVSKGLRENYFNKGMTEPYSINRAYATSPYWGGKVTYFMNDLDKFAQKHEQNQILVDINIPQFKVAAVSGLLASNKL